MVRKPTCLVITKAENYKPRFPFSSGALSALASLFTSVQHFLEMLVHYLVTLSYKPVQTTSLHIRRSMFLLRHAVRSQSQSPNGTMPLGIIIRNLAYSWSSQTEEDTFEVAWYEGYAAQAQKLKLKLKLWWLRLGLFESWVRPHNAKIGKGGLYVKCICTFRELADCLILYIGVYTVFFFLN